MSAVFMINHRWVVGNCVSRVAASTDVFPGEREREGEERAEHEGEGEFGAGLETADQRHAKGVADHLMKVCRTGSPPGLPAAPAQFPISLGCSTSLTWTARSRAYKAALRGSW
jgi:hypothetical protein